MFSTGKIEFWTHWQSVHKAEFLALGKALNIYTDYIDYLMFYPGREHVQWKHLQVQVYIQQ